MYQGNKQPSPMLHDYMNIRNEKETLLEIPWTLKNIKEYYKKLYSHTFDNLGKVDQFLKRDNLSKFTQKEIDNLNRLY